MDTLTPDLYWLAATALLTLLMWGPHILWLILQEGLGSALLDGGHTLQVKPMWAKPSQRAHDNATANLAAFAVLGRIFMDHGYTVSGLRPHSALFPPPVDTLKSERNGVVPLSVDVANEDQVEAAFACIARDLPPLRLTNQNPSAWTQELDARPASEKY